MTTKVQKNHFDRRKPFYPLVMNYLILLIGFKDLAARGVIKVLEKHSTSDKNADISALINGITDKYQNKEIDENQLRNNLFKISKGLENILGPLDLRSEFQGNNIRVDIDEIAIDIMQNNTYLISFLMRSAGNLFIIAHEISKDQLWHDNSPLWEFLRHCRNAAAHGGLFNLCHGEPRRTAKWGAFSIKASLNGTPLFKDKKDGKGLLSPGDPIRLLWDIEQAYPNMN